MIGFGLINGARGANTEISIHVPQLPWLLCCRVFPSTVIPSRFFLDPPFLLAPPVSPLSVLGASSTLHLMFIISWGHAINSLPPLISLSLFSDPQGAQGSEPCSPGFPPKPHEYTTLHKEELINHQATDTHTADAALT